MRIVTKIGDKKFKYNIKITQKYLIKSQFIKMIPVFETAPSIAIAPNFGAGSDARELRKEPIGVLTAETITTS